ncbi:hypothetical protein RESH_05885 [Rhodopirellula europaea SH398]|uniref:Uncharacterized protein n=1 Tax=Rhodopirellula europaea SH398 TaxID=1263868 RepID=M5SBI4_9BACT|nr:hypothetical protein RESH_05885 [Rhodopirellula europaea SH398]
MGTRGEKMASNACKELETRRKRKNGGRGVMRKRLHPRRCHLTMALVARRAPIGEAGRSNVWVRFARPLHLPAIG